MRAITYSAFGPADQVLTLVDLPTPDPKAGEVLVRLATSGVNPSDVKMRAGGRPGVTHPPFPQIIPHSDGAGTIEAVGEGVDPARIGQRVWIWNGQWQRAFGTAAEFVALPGDQAVPLPQSTPFEWGATLGIPGLTATQGVLGAGPVAGQTLLISGGAGTVGHIAIQIAKASGARVLATAGGDSGRTAAVAAGADHVFDYASPTLAAEILDTTDGRLIDRIVEVEFGRNAETNAQVIAENGSIAAYGSALDMAPQMPFYPLMFKAVTLDLMLIYLLQPEARRKAISNLHDLLNQGKLNIRISDSLPLEDCAKAQELVATGARAGSVLLTLQ